MKIVINEVPATNVIRRGIASQMYTLRKTADLKLFELKLVYQDDVDHADGIAVDRLQVNDQEEWETDAIEFWASSIYTARSELMSKLITFRETGAYKEAERESGFVNSRSLVLWVRRYIEGEGHLLNLKPGMCEHEILQRVVETDQHICYVHRKMKELYDGIDAYPLGRAWLESLK